MVNLDGQVVEVGVKFVWLKEWKFIFDFMIRQIKFLIQKELVWVDSFVYMEQQFRIELDKQEVKVSFQSFFEQMNWKELLCNEIIQFYLSWQSSLFLLLGVQILGVYYFMFEYLKQEESIW